MFSFAPLLFQQVYVLLAEREGFVFPVLYTLLPDKREATYRRMLTTVKEIWPQLVLEHIFVDFEKAAINAAPATLSAAQILGCFFHLVRNLTKQLAEQGLLTTYNTDAPFALSARMIASLTFVSPSHLDAAVEALWDELPLDVHPILEWFERTYMGCWRRSDGRGPAIFPPSVWSVYESTLMGADQANKFAQAAHRRIRSDFGGDHPTLWKFVDGLRRVHAGRDQHYEEYIRGDEPPRKRLKHIWNATGKYWCTEESRLQKSWHGLSFLVAQLRAFYYYYYSYCYYYYYCRYHYYYYYH
ncbi:hypothetical protein M513_12177 [Trichuris suis]|uniref:MULE transposase domain-containing protein n=1 Tax=Trichuris suis TaxID=68888 RepID=A0A085LPN5_9BILA|nr:hypothetical protein M513_12177 [Trichuris suis]